MQSETYDVVVVGSGAAGAMAALRSKELGLSVLILEKAHNYGGTSATSGGVLWVPNHGLSENGDSREESLKYLNTLVKGAIQRDRLEAFVDQAPEMVGFMKSLGIAVMAAQWPDYFPTMPGARSDRSGRRLGLFRWCALAGFVGWVAMASADRVWMPFVISAVVLAFSGAAGSPSISTCR